MGGGTASVACTDTSTTTKNFTKQYEDSALAVTGSTKTYWTMTNWWHNGTFNGQTVTINGLSMKLGNPKGASVPATDGSPMGFPSIFIGTYQNKATVGSNLPKKVSDIKSVPTIFNTNASSVDTANLNATYDVWFTATSAPLSSTMANSPGAGGAYLMVWLFKPAARQPRGGSGQATGASPNYPATTVNGVTGKWDVWVDKSSDPPCISYVASDPIDGLSYDLNNFIQDSVSKQYGITTSMYLSIIFAGFEVWAGGDGLENKQFCATVN
jgi:endoglucanase